MGSAASKAAKQGTRKLAAEPAKAASKLAEKTHVDLTAKHEITPQDLISNPAPAEPKFQSGNDFDPNLVKRLTDLGVVQFNELKTNFNENSESLTMLKNRKKLTEAADKEQEMDADSRPGVARSFLHTAEVTSLIEDLQKGMKKEELLNYYQIDESLLARLGTRFTMPDRSNMSETNHSKYLSVENIFNENIDEDKGVTEEEAAKRSGAEVGTIIETSGKYFGEYKPIDFSTSKKSEDKQGKESTDATAADDDFEQQRAQLMKQLRAPQMERGKVYRKKLKELNKAKQEPADILASLETLVDSEDPKNRDR